MLVELLFFSPTQSVRDRKQTTSTSEISTVERRIKMSQAQMKGSTAEHCYPLEASLGALLVPRLEQDLAAGEEQKN